MEKRLMGVQELAEYIGLKPRTIRNKLNCGTFPIPTKKIGRLLKWERTAVDAYLDKLKPIN